MNELISYETPQAFLDATQSILEQKELENNLILGICNAFEDKTKTYDHCVFINSIHNGQIQASSVKTLSKAILAGYTRDTNYIQPLADYYLHHDIELKGAIGETMYVKEFSRYYGKKVRDIHQMIAHRLSSVHQLPLVDGACEMATMDDIDLLTDWIIKFEVDAAIFPKQTVEQIHKSASKRISQGDFFKWVNNEVTVSIAAIVRKTKNIGIIGIVYTPDEFRGHGYATACVQWLSDHILSRGFTYCGLFTDKNNLTSNRIYKNIGYEPVADFSDILYQ